MTPVRLLLLALVVIGSLPIAGMGLPSRAVAVAAPADVGCVQVSRDGGGEHERGSLVRECACCSAEPETAAPRSEETLRLPSKSYQLAAASAPRTDEHLPLPFRPPMAS